MELGKNQSKAVDVVSVIALKDHTSLSVPSEQSLLFLHLFLTANVPD